MKKNTVALIGYGYWGVNYARILRQNKKINFKWICDANKKVLNEASAKFGVQTTSQIEDVLFDSEVSAVIIVTPPSTHFEIATKFLMAGKNILIEKPLTNDFRQAQKLAKLSKKKNLVLMTGFTFLYNNYFRYLRRYIKLGHLGSVRFINTTRTNLGPIRNDVDVIWDLSPHDLSMVMSITKCLPTEVMVSAAKYLSDRYDVAFINLKFPKNILVNIVLSWLSPIKVREFVVVGTKKMAVFDDVRMDHKLTIFNKGVTIPPRGSSFQEFLKFGIYQGKEEDPKINPQEPLADQVDYFLDSIKKKCLIRDVDLGPDVVKIIEACELSAKLGKPVKIKK